MNRKAFLILLALLVVLGGAGLALFWQDLGAWRGGNAKTGAKPLEKLALNEVAQIRVADGKAEATLAVKDGRWVVRQRGDYGANAQAIGDLLVKLPEVKIVQTENVGAALLPRLNLVQPDAAARSSDGAGTLLELSDQTGKTLAGVLLGKKVIKTEDSPLPIKQETPVGRYVLIPGIPSVLVISDALNSAEAQPERWLAKDFFKVERIKSLAASGDGAPWKIARSEEYGQWKFADGGGELDAGAATAAVNALAALEFSDVAPGVKAESLEKPRTLIAETFDHLTYTVRFARKPGSDDYYLAVALAGDPPRERRAEKGEQAADRERLDQQFADNLKKLDARLKLEKSLSAWTYVIAGKTLAPLSKQRSELVAAKRK